MVSYVFSILASDALQTGSIYIFDNAETSQETPRQPLVVTSVSGHSHSRLFFITDNSSGLKFLADAGAQVSVIPPAFTQKNLQLL